MTSCEHAMDCCPACEEAYHYSLNNEWEELLQVAYFLRSITVFTVMRVAELTGVNSYKFLIERVGA